ncbi:MAG: ArsR family transcriptional regulator [Bacteroidaceae bacterium]|nr:ArsR family transcriptional regulator [Prevotella sp.]MBR0183054.1 ArsR family transcriptional regulator [Bacteroidaceae bacterium]MBR1467496.1 ArsR family transcriptional regulator [Bacteroidaceae bacterium]
MNRRIVMDRGNVAKIAKTMNCTREMVSKALNYKKNSMLARKIRFVAKEQYGGIEIGNN